MGKQSSSPTRQPFDREVIRELARCYARAAVDELIAENKPTPTKPKPTAKRGGKAQQK
jgi:hypothetical protein